MRGGKRGSMKKSKTKIAVAVILGSLLTEACGMNGQGRAWAVGVGTPEDAVQCTMESLKALDLETFNACTDNYVETYYNWIGFPVETEYRVFNELPQPGSKRRKNYQFNLKMAEKTVEGLEWEITEVREKDGKAEIDMEITNLDMTDVTGYYEITILENMIAAEGLGMWQLMQDVMDLTNGGEELLAIMDTWEDTCTIPVTVFAWQENGGWKLHVDDDFVNAFMGNLNRGTYSDEIEQRLAQLEEEYADKVAEWE